MQIGWIDLTIFILYLLAMIAVGFYFLNKNKSKEDYFVGGRGMSAGHIGLSVVATDVGGGFSISLGGLGFVMGLSGSWMLLTGLIGAWLSAVLLIPKIYPVAKEYKFLTFPEILSFFYNKNVAFIAAIISLIGYIGFTSSQILAGAKLATTSFPAFSITEGVLIMGVIAVLYTTIGGIKAVIYTDTIQWIILMGGLLFFGIPYGYYAIGGWEAIKENVGPELLTLNNISWVDLFNWFITIVPIWFVGMTLYQRIYACKDEATAKKAWRIAGLFEWPMMAFLGVILGLFAKVAYEKGMLAEAGYASNIPIDPELGLPLFLSNVLPVGIMGLMMSAYFSAIMSTADSCLMAASGNLTTDIIGAWKKNYASSIRVSQLVTLIIGTIAIVLATYMTDVLELMLYSYAFMVSGLLIPVLAMLMLKKPSPIAALTAMILGGLTTLILILSELELPFGINANFFGILTAAISFLIVELIMKGKIIWRSSP